MVQWKRNSPTEWLTFLQEINGFLPVVFMREVGVKSSYKLTEWALKRKEKKYIHLEEQSVSVFSVLYKGKELNL